MTKLDAVLDNWKKRDLSYQGRSQVLSKFALSKVYYIAKTLTIPQNYIRQIEIKAKQFIAVLWLNGQFVLGQSPLEV